MTQYRLHIATTCALTVLIIVGSYAITTHIRQQLNENLIENYIKEEQRIARSIAHILESEIQSALNQLSIMARDPLIATGNTADCTAEIRDIIKDINPKLGNIGRVDRTGTFKCSLNEALIGRTASDFGSYITEIFSDPAHRPVMSRAVTVPGAEGYITAIHVPVSDKQGAFDGTLGGAIYLQQLEEKYLKDVSFAERGFVALFDDDGTVLYHKHKQLIGTKIGSPAFAAIIEDIDPFVRILEEVRNGTNGVVRYINLQEGQKVAAYEPVSVVDGRKWVVFVTVPIADAQRELAAIGVEQLLSYTWQLVALVVLLLGAGFVVLSRHYIFKPLQQIQEMKTGFVSLVSHQLKTPVAQIKGFTENMLEGLTGPLNIRQREYLADMLKVANKNSKLIDDLLDISRLERGMLKVSIEPLMLTELLNEILAPLRAIASNKGVRLEEHIPPSSLRIMGDPVKTREAIRNIVDNAIKFTPKDSTVTVSVTEKPQSVILSVEDHGEGIDPDVQTELFEKNRVWSGKVKASGAGLGLYLSKNFIELSGGTLSYTTGKDGTTFYITLNKAP